MLFISPHNDDETLFGAFTLHREKPTVLIVFDSYVQVARGNINCDAHTRRLETRAACRELGIMSDDIVYLGLRDDTEYSIDQVATALEEKTRGMDRSKIWSPIVDNLGHAQHNLVGLAVSSSQMVDPDETDLVRYGTYTTAGKMTTGLSEVIPAPEAIRAKMLALSCYKSQIKIENCREHFLRDLKEYQL